MRNHLKSIHNLWILLGPFHKRFYFQLFLIFISQIIVVVYAKLNAEMLNSLVGKNISAFAILASIWLITIIIDNGINYISKLNSIKQLEQKIYQHLEEISLKKLFTLNISQYIEEHSSLKQTALANGEVAVQNIINIIITSIIPTVSLVIISIITLAFYSNLIAVISLFIIVIIFTWAYFFNKKQYPLIIKNRDNWNDQRKIRTESFTHLSLIKTLNRGDYFIKNYLDKRMQIIGHHVFTRSRAARHSITRDGITELFSLITLTIAALLFLKGTYSIGIIYLIWNLTSRVYWQISSLSNNIRDIPVYYADSEKFMDIMDKEKSFDESGKKNLSINGDIIFNEVKFKYPKHSDYLFNDLSFEIPGGKVTAFVGSSGSGKTTITKILLRSYDYQDGNIQINHHELKNIDAGYLREHIGYVEQHIDLLDDTIKENILISVPEKKRKEAEKRLEDVAKLARIDQFYDRLGETKFDTLVGERGIKLSGGERQRIGIARAIIKNPEILIFDESTSSLDTENESKVMEAINDVSVGKTTIIIAHRLSTVKNADKIIVMDKGKVVGAGTHEELMQSSLIYQTLVAHQLS
ncbi:MAG: multidrug transporter ATP-binding protein [Candidatus Nomurabacteria bacterium]|nr:multidrug transporter ATP-binding protein [Candidatus Nomurabacteria bacterium]